MNFNWGKGIHVMSGESEAIESKQIFGSKLIEPNLFSRCIGSLLVVLVHDGAAICAAVADAVTDGVGRLEGDAHAGVERADAAAPRHLLGRAGVGQVEQGVVDGRAAQHDAVGRRRGGAEGEGNMVSSCISK